MINMTNELQYLLVIELLEKAAAGFMDHDELARACGKQIFPPDCVGIVLAIPEKLR